VSKESATEDIHRAVEEAINNGLTVKDFIREASISWSQVLLEAESSAKTSWQKLLDTNGVY
jgi:hypothetical protein